MRLDILARAKPNKCRPAGGPFPPKAVLGSAFTPDGGGHIFPALVPLPEIIATHNQRNYWRRAQLLANPPLWDYDRVVCRVYRTGNRLERPAMRPFLIALTLAAAFPAGGRLWAASADAIIPIPTAEQHGMARPWCTQVQLNSGRGRIRNMVLHEGVLYVQTDQATITALDAETGRTTLVENDWTTRASQHDPQRQFGLAGHRQRLTLCLQSLHGRRARNPGGRPGRTVPA